MVCWSGRASMEGVSLQEIIKLSGNELSQSPVLPSKDLSLMTSSNNQNNQRQLFNIGLFGKLKRKKSSYLYRLLILKCVSCIYSLNCLRPLRKSKEKKYSRSNANDNIGSTDFHIFNCYFVIYCILFLLRQLNPLEGQKKEQFVLRNQNSMSQMALSERCRTVESDLHSSTHPAIR